MGVGIVEFRVLGSMEVSLGDGPIELGPRMHRMLLAMLVMEANRVVSVDRLIDQLWPEEPPDSASATLQGYVSILRRALEPGRPPRARPQVLATQPPGYVLRTPLEAVDAVRFEALAAEGRNLLRAGRPGAARDTLRSALALWRGQPYADIAYETFVQLEVARLGELRAHASETLAEAHLQAGDSATAVTQLERLVASDPLREHCWELLATALYRCGRQAEALRALAEARRTLADELGLDPGPALRRLEDDILNQSPSLDWQTPVERPLDRPTGDVPSLGTGAAALDRPLVGRGEELASLESALDAAIARRGTVALVAGEPGIGKTRLAEELADRATSLATVVAWGRCDESEGAAYSPWVQIVRALIEEGEAGTVRRALRGDAAEIAQIVPEVKDVVGGEPGALPLLEPDAARARLYDAVANFVLRMAAEGLVVVVVDDLQWADVPSLQIVRRLAPRLAAHSVLLVCTCRDVDVDESDALRSTMASIARVPGLARVHPPPLSTAEVADLVTRTTGSRPPRGVAEAIHARTDGNPFFAAELVRLLRSRHGLGEEGREIVAREIPAGVRDVIRMRVGRLPENAGVILSAAAVVGATFDLDVLIAASGLDEEPVLDLIESAVLAGIVTEDPHHVGRYRFSHGLVRDTLVEGLSDVRRSRLHRKVGRAMAGIIDGGGGISVFDVAHHLQAGSGAGAAEEALAWTVRAAEEAMARLAFEQAEAQLRRAISLLERIPAGPDVSSQELALQLQLGSLMDMTRGSSEPAVEQAWRRALQLARASGDGTALLSSLWGLWARHLVRAEYAEALVVADELLQEGERSNHPVMLMIGHETIGVIRWLQGGLTDAEAHLKQAMAIADALPDEVFTGILLQEHPGIICRCYLSIVSWLLGERQRAQDVLEEATTLAGRVAHPHCGAFVLFSQAGMGMVMRDGAAVVERADELIVLARKHGFRQWPAWGTILRGWGLAQQGRFETALAQLEPGLGEQSARGSRMLEPFFLGLTAEAQQIARRPAEALITVELALAAGEAVGERFWKAELLRLKGELLVAGTPAQAAEADECFQQALVVARAQGARALEGRVAQSVARNIAGPPNAKRR